MSYISFIDRVRAAKVNAVGPETVRQGRLRALARLPRDYVVTVTSDGASTWNLTFMEPPTIKMLSDMAPDAYLAGVKSVRHVPRHEERVIDDHRRLHLSACDPMPEPATEDLFAVS